MPSGLSYFASILGVSLLASSAWAVDFYQPLKPARPFEVVVHRGMRRQAPENLLPALKRAAEDGFEWIEVDVRRSADHQHVLFHDSRLEGKCDGQGPLGEQTLEQLKALDAGSWFAPRYTGQRLLTLPEALAWAKGRVNLYLDCKDADPAKLVEEILATDMASQVVVYADLNLLKEVREKSAGRVPILAKWRPEFGLEPWIAQWHPDMVEIDAEQLTPEACQVFHAAGIRVEAQVLGDNDTPEAWDRMLAAGADLLQTDLPEDLVAHRVWKSRPNPPVQISCHRGANRYAPENTLPAFQKAIALGVNYAEFDVRHSRDGQYFILHDGSLGRTTNGKGPISAMEAAQIRQLDAGAKFGLPFQGTPLPTFDAALDVLGGQIGLYVDAKDISAEDLARVLVERKLLDQSVVYQGPDYLKALRLLAPEARGLCPLNDPSQVEALAEQAHPYAFDVAWEILSQDLIARCHAQKIRVFADELPGRDTIEEYQRAMDWGIDVIQTDHPLRVMRAAELYRPKAP